MDHEKRVRDTAAAFADAVIEAKKAGYSVSWPASPEIAQRVEISETGKGKVTTTVTAANVDPAVLAKAQTAAQNAADKVLDKAEEAKPAATTTRSTPEIAKVSDKT